MPLSRHPLFSKQVRLQSRFFFHQRKPEDSNLTRLITVRIVFQTIFAPREFGFRFGQDGRIRTCDLQSPRLALLPG